MSSGRSKRKRREHASAPEEQTSQPVAEAEAGHEVEPAAAQADAASSTEEAEPEVSAEAAQAAEAEEATEPPGDRAALEGEAEAEAEAASHDAAAHDADAELDGEEHEGHEPGPEGEPSAADVKRWLESLIFVADKPVTAQHLARAVKMRLAATRALLEDLMVEYEPRGIQLVELASGYQFRSSPASAHLVRDAVAAPPVRLTRAQLETLALVAYRQPITRPEVDEVRGVDSGSALRVLLERGLLKMLGRKDEPGRPLLYGTTPHFLEFFGMRSLKDLPTLREFTELSDENRALFKRKTGESVEEAEASLLAADEKSRSDEGEAEPARQADAAEGAVAGEAQAEPAEASTEPAEPAAETEADEVGAQAAHDEAEAAASELPEPAHDAIAEATSDADASAAGDPIDEASEEGEAEPDRLESAAEDEEVPAQLEE